MSSTVTFWLMPNAGFESRRCIEHEIKLFHKQYPRTKVVYEMFSWSHAWPRIMQAIKEKAGPDIIQVGTSWIGTLGYLGAVQKLENRQLKTDMFVPAVFNMCRCFGHLWAIPWFCEGRVLYYRKDYLAKAGVTEASLDTWDAFRKACEKITAIGKRGPRVAPFGFPGLKEQAMPQDLGAWIWGHDGDFLSADGKHAALDLPEARLGFKFLIDLIARGSIARQSLDQSSGEVVQDFFMHDAYAAIMASSWPLQVYLNPSSAGYIGDRKAQAIGVALVPSGPEGRYNFTGGSALAVTSFCRHPEAACHFLDFLTGRESLARYARTINMLPGRHDIPSSVGGTPREKELFQQSVVRYGRSFPSHPLWGSIEQIIVNGFAQSLDAYKETGDQAHFMKDVAEMSQEIEYILSIFGE